MQVLLKMVASRPVVSAMVLVSVIAMAGCGGGNSSSSANNVTATPTFSPDAGSYNASQTVTVADSTAGAVLYCTTDGTTPTTSSPRCSQPTTVFKTEFLQAIAVAPGMTSSSVASAGYTIDLSAAATPTFSPAGGTYPSAQTVTIKDATSGSNIFFTTDGSVPTSSSTLYTGPITVSQTETLSAIAIASGYNNSGVASADYTIGTGTATPVISPAGGTFTAAQSVTITDATAGATIYYTVDGSAPTSSSTAYSGPITVSSTETISAIAIASGNNSSIATASFTINISAASPAATPTFSPAGGTYSSTQAITLSDTTPGASIFYTTDGSTPTTSSTRYISPITVSTTETIKAIATASGFSTSAISSADYTINTSSVALPTFSPTAGTYGSAQTVTISDTTSGATIYYTTDGSNPTTSSTQYSAPITISATETLQAIAAVGSNTSSVATAIFTINSGPAFSGTVLSGTAPVSGAQVQMYAAGQAGYGTSATALLTTAATTDASGAFNFTFNCPDPTSGDLVFLVASGGSIGSSGPNPNLVLMAALGSCNGTLLQNVVVNEITTVASAYALSQFMTGAQNVGSSATNYSVATGGPGVGLANAFNAVSNLVDLTTGQARTHTPAYAADLAHDSQILNNSTVPQTRINTLANALNACATNSSACSSLFSAATPNGGTAPSDTLQAILNIAQNPGNNAASLFNVASPSGPFMPALSAAPNDWTLALTFTGAGLGLQPGTSSLSPDGLIPIAPFFNSTMAIDATGNIWVTAYSPGQSGVETSMVAKFNNLGAPLTPVTTLDSTASPSIATPGGYVVGGVSVFPASGIASVFAPGAMAIDTNGNVWVAGGTAPYGGGYPPSLAEISPDLSLLQGSLPMPFSGSGNTGALTMAINGFTGDIWISGNGISGEFQKYSNSGTPSSSDYTGTGPDPNNPYIYPGAPFGFLGNLPQLVFDSNGAMWGESNDGLGSLYLINTSDGSIPYNPFLPDSSFNPTGVYTPIAPDGSGNLYACGDLGGQKLDVINAASQSKVNPYSITTGRGCGGQMVMDGQGHLFVVSGGAAPGVIDEFATAGGTISQISPATGYTGTSSGEAITINPDPTNQPPIITGGLFTPVQVPASGIAAAAIDGSGNLWVLNPDTGTTSSPGNVLVEYIGIAAPVVTPTSLAQSFGELGVRP